MSGNGSRSCNWRVAGASSRSNRARRPSALADWVSDPFTDGGRLAPRSGIEIKASLDELSASSPEVIVVPAIFVRTFLPQQMEPGERLPAVIAQKRAGGGEAFFAQVHARTLT